MRSIGDKHVKVWTGSEQGFQHRMLQPHVGTPVEPEPDIDNLNQLMVNTDGDLPDII
jgi:hypothetical protein